MLINWYVNFRRALLYQQVTSMLKPRIGLENSFQVRQELEKFWYVVYVFLPFIYYIHFIFLRFSVFSFSLLSAYWSISEMLQRKIKQNIFLNIVIVDSQYSHGSQNIKSKFKSILLNHDKLVWTQSFLIWNFSKGENLLKLIFSEGVEHCVPYHENTSQQVDLAFNVGFMIYFLIRVNHMFIILHFLTWKALPGHELSIE